MQENDILDPFTRPAQDMVDDLHKLFDHLKWRLFDDDLPNPNFSLKCQHGSYGYYRPESHNSENGRYCGEITVNPACYSPENPLPFIAAFAHQMVHHWQYYFGTPGRGCYHNREWADKTISIGLQPSSTGEPDGRETGDTMHHFIIEGGPLERSAHELVNDGALLRWQECYSAPSRSAKSTATSGDMADLETGEEGGGGEQEAMESKSGKRFVYTCPVEDCRSRAESFHNAELGCWIHKLKLERTERNKRQRP